MNRASATIAAVVLLPVVVFVGLPATRYFTAERETLPLDDAARRNAPNGEFVQLSGGMTHYQVGGPAGGRVVLLINGFSTPYNVWDPTFEGLANAGYRVLRYDLFGRGFSDRPIARYDADFFDRQALDLLNALHIGQVDVGGLSMGGPIAV